MNARDDSAYEARERAGTPAGTPAERSRGGPRHQRPTMVRVAVCWVALIATIVCNGLFESMRLGGVTAAEVSNQVFVWFMPSGYVFSIWGVIYAALVIWMIAITRKNRAEDAISPKRASLFVASCALNVLWLALFHFQQIAPALVVLVGLFAVLAALYLDMRNRGVSKMMLAPFSLYFAWSTVALIVNATNLATRMVVASLIVEQLSTIALGIAVLAVGALSVRNSRDYVFPLVILWAVVGVAVHLMGVDALVATILLVLAVAGAAAAYLPPLFAPGGFVRRNVPRVGKREPQI